MQGLLSGCIHFLNMFETCLPLFGQSSSLGLLGTFTCSTAAILRLPLLLCLPLSVLSLLPAALMFWQRVLSSGPMLMSALLNMPMPVLPLDLSTYFTVCTASKVEIFMLDLLVSVRSSSVNNISHETKGGLYQWPMKDGEGTYDNLAESWIFPQTTSQCSPPRISQIFFFQKVAVFFRCLLRCN